MTYTVTITRQGQISIPVAIRRKYGLDKNRTAIVKDQGKGEIVIEPVPDLLSLKGAFKSKKRFTDKQIREAFEMYLATRHLRKNFLSK